MKRRETSNESEIHFQNGTFRSFRSFCRLQVGRLLTASGRRRDRRIWRRMLTIQRAQTLGLIVAAGILDRPAVTVPEVPTACVQAFHNLILLNQLGG